jgi:hydroxypyruvate isomerase
MRAELAATGLPMLALNTRRGDPDAGEFGLAAVPGRERPARAFIDEAIAYAAAAGIPKVHVMAGIPGEAGKAAARRTFLDALRYAAKAAAPHGVTILIEPINARDAPGYHLAGTDQAADLIEEVGHTNVKLMFDCYHVQILEGDLTKRIERLLPVIGHIQIAGVPARDEPDAGEVAYERLLPMIEALGYDGFIGAEYRPRGTTDEGLGWLKRFRG